MIQIQIAGRVGKDADVRQVNSQYAITFPVAHSHSYYNDQGTKIESTIWVKCTYWAKRDNISKYIRKGNVVFCAGIPKAHAWKDNDGKPHAQLEMTVKDFDFIYSKPTGDATVGGTAQFSGSSAPGFSNPPADTNDDLPF